MTSRPADRLGRWARGPVGEAAFAVVIVALLLRTRPGRVGVDTKQYLFLDPGRLLRDAPYMWDPDVAFGTVPHQNIGFLWPMGPFFWLGDALSVPDWVTQRLWLAGLFVVAGLGVRRFLLRAGLGHLGAWVGALAYACSPYVLGYVHRTSVLLLPWAGLGWLLVCTDRALRERGWRWPAALALVALTIGAANATAFLLVLPAPALWALHRVVVDRTVALPDAWRAAWRSGLLTAGVSAWWVVALVVQGRYSLNVLRYSETIDAVARSSSSAEVLRGLGYWLFYGRDRLEPWIEPAPPFQARPVLIALTMAIPVVALVAAVVLRWRHRAYFAVLVVVGAVAAVGAHPWDDPSPLGGIFKQLALDTDAGLALRSSSRAVPLLVLGMAGLLGAAVEAVRARVPLAGAAGGGLAMAVAVAALPPLWQGDLVAGNLSRPERLPAHWVDAVAALDRAGTDSRILEVPGIDLTFHRWGATWEPLTPGLTDRPYAAREVVPYGAPGSVDLLTALDRRLQEGTIEPASLAPISRLLNVGHLVVRSDLEHERYRTPRPRVLWATVLDAAGLEPPQRFGPPEPNRAGPLLPLLDEIELRTPEAADHPPPVAAFEVRDARPIVAVEPVAGAVVVAGSGDGLVDAAAAGLLDGTRLVLYDATLAGEPGELARYLEGGADLLVTDTNRRRASRWRTLRDNAGFTETAGEVPLVEDPSDARLDLFPGVGPLAGDRHATVTEVDGPRARATGYGNPVTYTPDQRPQLVLDGDPTTAWRVGAFADVRGERLVVDLPDPVAARHVDLVQAPGPATRSIARIAVAVDGGPAVEVDLDASSSEPPGQRVALPGTPIEQLAITILETDPPTRGSSGGESGVGFATVAVDGVETAREVVRLPVDLLARDRGEHRLVVLLSRLRSDPGEVVRGDDELALRRRVELAHPRSFGVTGWARLADDADDAAFARVLGLSGPDVRASDSLGGDHRSRPFGALDRDPSTRWRPGFGEQVGRWIEVDAGTEVTVDRLALDLVTDGRHSVPTRVAVSVDGDTRSVALPAVDDHDEPGATSRVEVDVPALTGRVVRVTVEEVREVRTRDWYSLRDITTPVGVAALDLPGVAPVEQAERLPAGCRDDLLEVDGSAVAVVLSGTTEAALDREPLAVATCDGDPLDLAAGTHDLVAAEGRRTGIDLDRVALASGVGGGPLVDLAPLGGRSATTDDRAGPTVRTVDRSRTSYDLVVDTRGDDTVLVLGQNRNDGWRAELGDGTDLGPPTLVNGYANGWVVPGRAEPVEVRLRWAPQRAVWAGLAVSALAVAACLALVVVGRRPPARIERADRVVTPELAAPWTAGPGWQAAAPGPLLAAAAATGLATGLATRPWIGAVAALAVAVAGRVRWGRIAPAALGAVAAGAMATSVVLGQAANAFPPDFDWPGRFPTAHVLGWVALAGLAADGAARWLRRRRTPDDRPQAGPPVGSGAR